VIAHIGGKMRKHYIQILPGDRVKLVISLCRRTKAANADSSRDERKHASNSPSGRSSGGRAKGASAVRTSERTPVGGHSGLPAEPDPAIRVFEIGASNGVDVFPIFRYGYNPSPGQWLIGPRRGYCKTC
jgi:hypothetical protein